jgi:hypothetical protein
MAKKESTLTTPANVSSGASVNVRKIDNGYIVSKSSYGPKGYTSSEHFCATPPKVEIETGERERKSSASPAKSSLRKAMDSI